MLRHGRQSLRSVYLPRYNINPVIGWTSHHSIIEFKGKWYLFYHDTQVSGGKTYLRNVKVTELQYDANGKIIPINPYGKSSK